MNTTQLGPWVLTAGVAMLALGLTLPFVVGTRIPPVGYNVLQVGGIALALVGFAARAVAKRTKA